MIRVITYNCQGLKSSIHDIQALCSSYDLIFIQESWLFQFELPLFGKFIVSLKDLVLVQSMTVQVLFAVDLMVAWQFL